MDGMDNETVPPSAHVLHEVGDLLECVLKFLASDEEFAVAKHVSRAWRDVVQSLQRPVAKKLRLRPAWFGVTETLALWALETLRCPPTKRLCKLIASNGWLAALSAAEKGENGIRVLLTPSVLAAALERGQEAAAQWLHARAKKANLSSSKIIEAAALSGRVDAVRWAWKAGYRLSAAACAAAAKSRSLGVLHWLRFLDPPCPWGPDTCAALAENGDLEILRWARESGCAWNADACTAAAHGGRLDVLQWLRAQNPPCPWNANVCIGAARRGHLDILKWARARDCPWDAQTCAEAIRKKHFAVLKWARSNGCPWDENVWCLAALNRDFEALGWILSEGHCPRIQTLCTTAAGWNLLDVLRWARARDPPCPWGAETLAAAALVGAFDLVRWARAQDPPCPWDLGVCINAALGASGGVGVPVLALGPSAPPVPWRHFELLKWARANGAPWEDAQVCAAAARAGRLDVLEWLRAEGCPWNSIVIDAGLENGHFELCCWALANGCPDDADLGGDALEELWARCAHAELPDCLQTLLDLELGAFERGHVLFAALAHQSEKLYDWAARNGFVRWEPGTAAALAEKDELDELRWAHAHGCPLDADVCVTAVLRGNLEILRWACEHGAPWDSSLLDLAAEVLGSEAPGRWTPDVSSGLWRRRLAQNDLALAKAKTLSDIRSYLLGRRALAPEVAIPDDDPFWAELLGPAEEETDRADS